MRLLILLLVAWSRRLEAEVVASSSIVTPNYNFLQYNTTPCAECLERKGLKQEIVAEDIRAQVEQCQDIETSRVSCVHFAFTKVVEATANIFHSCAEQCSEPVCRDCLREAEIWTQKLVESRQCEGDCETQKRAYHDRRVRRCNYYCVHPTNSEQDPLFKDHKYNAPYYPYTIDNPKQECLKCISEVPSNCAKPDSILAKIKDCGTHWFDDSRKCISEAASTHVVLLIQALQTCAPSCQKIHID